MKKMLMPFLALLLLPVILVLSCQKEFFLPIADQGYSEKTFSFNNTAAVSVVTPTGLKISLPANAFVNSNGQAVTTDISLLVKEILKPGAMILQNKPTVSDGLPLESGGEFYLRATSGGNVLRLAPSVNVQMELPPIPYNMNNMQVFRGIENTTTGELNWQPNNNSGVRVQPRDSLQSGTGYYLFSDGLDWINCDRFINEPTISYSVNPGNCPNRDSTSVYIHLTGRNAVLKIYPTGALFSSDNLIAVQATIVGICSVNGKLSASIRSAALQNGQSITLNFTPVSEEALKGQLNLLQ